MGWFALALSSVVFFTTLNLLQRVLAVKSRDPRAMSLVFNFIAAILATLIFFVTGSHKNFSLPTGYSAWITLAVACLMYGLYERGRFYAAKYLEASTLIIVLNISVVVAFIGSLFLYSEPLSLRKLIGATLILIALSLVSYNKKSFKRGSRVLKGIMIGFLISVFLGIGWMLDKLGAAYFNANTYSILVWTIPIAIIYFPYIKLATLKNELKVTSWKIAVLALLNVIGYLLQLKALELQEATRVIPIVQTSTLTTVLAGVVLLNEKEHLVKKVIAGFTAFAGVYFLI